MALSPQLPPRMSIQSANRFPTVTGHYHGRMHESLLMNCCQEPVSRSPCALLKLDFPSLADKCIQQMHWLVRSSSFSKAQGLRETGPRHHTTPATVQCCTLDMVCTRPAMLGWVRSDQVDLRVKPGRFTRDTRI